jgi:hypothetical protein
MLAISRSGINPMRLPYSTSCIVCPALSFRASRVFLGITTWNFGDILTTPMARLYRYQYRNTTIAWTRIRSDTTTWASSPCPGSGLSRGFAAGGVPAQHRVVTAPAPRLVRPWRILGLPDRPQGAGYGGYRLLHRAVTDIHAVAGAVFQLVLAGRLNA